MPPQGIISYGRLSGFISGTFTLSHGTQPSPATIYVPPNPNIAIPEVGVLTIAFGGDRLTFPDCRFQRQTVEQSDDGTIIWGIHLLDQRWKWRFGSISGFYNVTIGERTKTIRKPTEKTPRELLRLCFDALGMKPGHVDLSTVPDDARPEVSWENNRIDLAIDEICRVVGCRVVLMPNGRVKIVPQGVGRPLPVLPYTNYSQELEPPLIPDAIRFVGARTLREVDIPLEAVGLEPRGEIALIDNLSYKPRSGWSTSDIEYFADVSLEGREPAAASLYRYWRPKLPFSIPQADKLPEVRVSIVEQILPLLDHQVTRQKIRQARGAGGFDAAQLDTLEMELPAVLWGDWYNQNLSLTSRADPEQRHKELDELEVRPNLNLDYYTHLKVDGFQIDRERGLIISDEPLFRIVGEEQLREPAILYLRVAVQYRDRSNFSGAWVHGEKKEKLRRIPIGTGDQVIVRDDVALESRIHFNGLKKIGTHKSNYTDFNKKATYYINAAKSLLRPGDPATATYVGLKAIPADGAIQQVTWHINDDGFCFTRVSRNREESLIVPSYEQRQMIARIREEIERQQRGQGQPKK